MAVTPVPSEALDGVRRDIAERARALSGDADSAERQALVSEHKELKDRLSLGAIGEDVRAEIERQVKIAALKKVGRARGTGTKRLITTKNKIISWVSRCVGGNTMTTNLAIDPKLLNKALEVGGEKTKKAIVNRVLREFIARREQERLLDLFGNLNWDDEYDYKRERMRR
jgi:hypothetical protein